MNTFSRYEIYLTFDRPCKLVDFKNKKHLYLKVTKTREQIKCQVNCVSGMPEGRVAMRFVGVRKIYDDGSSEERERERE